MGPIRGIASNRETPLRPLIVPYLRGGRSDPPPFFFVKPPKFTVRGERRGTHRRGFVLQWSRDKAALMRGVIRPSPMWPEGVSLA